RPAGPREAADDVGVERAAVAAGGDAGADRRPGVVAPLGHRGGDEGPAGPAVRAGAGVPRAPAVDRRRQDQHRREPGCGRLLRHGDGRDEARAGPPDRRSARGAAGGAAGARDAVSCGSATILRVEIAAYVFAAFVATAQASTTARLWRSELYTQSQQIAQT